MLPYCMRAIMASSARANPGGTKTQRKNRYNPQGYAVMFLIDSNTEFFLNNRKAREDFFKLITIYKMLSDLRDIVFNRVKPRINMKKVPVNSFKPLIDLLKPFINTLKTARDNPCKIFNLTVDNPLNLR
ncbi:hypothetical protein A2935_03900 [Candidatus Wolfebacteria bacterium RIFCSPLOWO2_01_FULL_47_17b]|uniref:Uncharacterized protein n=1 Tax=Candidatus Wolfebacteria bacterium RIFCSPLOWO2_01_FULL_47_17b TaxID=1802558 RepID=A0A1F8DWW4_9BACT|nr:MAG: hypothetical protein A2935_03900 [Candidatus Wolfebacteria bacterium RIFCSPLOWO2_01_FULL_47_17b]